MAQTRRGLKIETRTDVMLALLGAAERPVKGMTRLVKLLFLAEKEANVGAWLAPGEQYYGFRPYRMGPFSADVYDDVELLEQCNLIEGKPGREAIAEEIEEWRAMFADDLMPEPDPSSAKQEVNRAFELTPDGTNCAHELLASLPEASRRALQGLRTRYDRLRLRDLLVYVYTRYPDMTEASEIKQQLGLA